MKTLTLPVPDFPTVKKNLLKLCGLLFILYLCYAVRQIWLPLTLAFLLAMVLDPIVDRMETRGWSRPWASAFIFGSFLTIMIGLAVLAYPFIVAQVSTLQAGLVKYFPDSSQAGMRNSFRHMGMSASFSDAAALGVEGGKSSLQHSTSWLSDIGLSIASNSIWVVIVPIVAFYALRDFHVILAKGLLLVPAKRRDLIQTAVTEITGIFGKFLRGLLIVSVLNGIATATLLSILRVPAALVLGLAAGLLYSVPYMGSMLTLFVVATVAFVSGGPNMLLVTVSLSLLLDQVIFGKIITPRILGKQVGLHPILSILALLAGNLLLGIIGMILAVPVAACIQIAVLAMIPKLSREGEISPQSGDDGDTVSSLERETKAEHQRASSNGEIHSAATTAVAVIEAASSQKEAKTSPSS